MNPNQQENCRKLLERSLQEHSRRRAIVAKLPQQVEPGDLFVLRAPKPVPVKWCAIFHHSRDPDLWFFVPGDEFSLVGTRDIAVPAQADFGPLNLRCACGLWVHRNDFDLKNRIGHIHETYVEQVRDHVSRMLENDLPTAALLADVDNDPDYADWIEELSDAVDELEKALLEADANQELESGTRERIFVINAASASQTWYDSVPGLEHFTALAADTGQSDVDSGTRPPGIRVPFSGVGDLIALVDERGVELQLFNCDASDTPAVTIEDHAELIHWHSLESMKTSWFASDLIPWLDNHIALRIGTSKFVIQRQESDD